MPRTARRPFPLVPTATATLLLSMVIAVGAVAPAAMSATGGEKVTICHRTHSVTNPYRMITVSVSSITNNAGHLIHDVPEEFKADLPPVFDPSFSYDPNRKYWGDIIPPVRNAGLNWSAAGQAIYTGIGTVGLRPAFGLCKRMSAKEFYDSEVAAGVDPVDVLKDLDDQASDDDEELKKLLNINRYRDLEPTNLPPGFNSTPPAPGGAPPPAGYGPKEGEQRLAVVVWYDLDRDGAYDADERPAPGVTVSLAQIVEVSSAGFGGASTLVMAAGTRQTDANGNVIVDDIPAGQWDVNSTPPANNEVTYDSQGAASDGRAQVDVPANSAGFAWVGLVPSATGPGGGPGADPRLAATGASSTATPAIAGIAAALLLLGFALVRRSLRRGRHAAAR